MENECRIESFCGLDLFKRKEWDEIDVDSMYFYEVEWLLPSMRKYNGLGVTKDFDGSIRIDSEDGAGTIFDGCLFDIIEVVEFARSKIH